MDENPRPSFAAIWFKILLQYKKSADRYYAEFNQNAQVMTNSLKNIENIVVDVLNDQVRPFAQVFKLPKVAWIERNHKNNSSSAVPAVAEAQANEAAPNAINVL